MTTVIKTILDSNGVPHDIIDTKNTAGANDSTEKLFLVGATEQSDNPQTYTNVNCYVSGNHLYSNNGKVITEVSAVAGRYINSVGTPTVRASNSDDGKTTLTFDYLKGEKGDAGSIGSKGDKGDKGDDGTSVTITSISQNTRPGGTSTINFSDGNQLLVTNGSNGTNATTTTVATSNSNGLMSSTDKTKLDKFWYDYKYEIIVPMSSYETPQSFLSKQSATIYNDITELQIGDIVRIKSDLEFPTNQSPSVFSSNFDGGFDVQKCQSLNGSLTCKLLFSLEWDINNIYGNAYVNGGYYSRILYKWGGYIDVKITHFSENTTPKTYYCVPLYNNVSGGVGSFALSADNANHAYDADTADNATNASNIKISTTSSNLSYPLVFTSTVTAGNKPLYTDSVNSLHYNPSTNVLTVPSTTITSATITSAKITNATITSATITSAKITNATITTATASTVKTSVLQHPSGASTTSYSIECKNPLQLYQYTNCKSTFNIKGSDHNSEGVTLYGGSNTDVAKITVNGKGGDTTSRGEIVCGKVTYSGGSLGTSDERLKTFVNDIDIDFDKLKQIPKKYFTWNFDKENVLNIGTSAQEVEKIYPEIVGEFLNETENVNYKTIDYSKLSIIALAAIDKLNERIVELENKIKDLEQK